MTKKWLLLVFVLLSSISFISSAETSPEKMLRQVTDQMVERLNQDKAKVQADPQYVYTLVEEILVPHADFKEMSKRVLATHWRNASEQQRALFQAQFKILVIRTYATAFRAYKNEQVVITGSRYGHGNNRIVEVSTLVKQTSGPDIGVNYRMLLNEEGWKVYDLNVEGVGLVSSFNSQFNESIRAKGLDAVIADLAARNAEGLKK